MTATPDELRALAKRCEEASGPDRQLEWDIADALGEIPEHEILERGSSYGWYRRAADRQLGRPTDSEGRRYEWWRPEERTTSLDAAAALTERLLPGVAWTLGQNVHHRYWIASINTVNDEGGPWSVGCSGATATPALALVAAALYALAARHERGDE